MITLTTDTPQTPTPNFGSPQSSTNNNITKEIDNNSNHTYKCKFPKNKLTTKLDDNDNIGSTTNTEKNGNDGKINSLSGHNCQLLLSV